MSEIVSASRKALKALQLPDSAVEYLSASPHPDPHALAWLEHDDHRLIVRGDGDYPPQLEAVADGPAALFVDGDPAALVQPQVAIVGSRHASVDGLDNATRFAASLARVGLVVTSGMALGIDAAAHRGALQHGRTVAVLGSGPDIIYPARNAELAGQIRANGCIVSEFAPGIAPRREHFPQRNRIVSGLALGVLVVEAGLKSGSLITARLATEQGRTVCALPGSIHNPMARGCHRLIKDGAVLIETTDELIETLAPLAQDLKTRLQERLDQDAPPLEADDNGPNLDLDPEYSRLLEAIGHDPQPIDRLVECSGLSAEACSSMLLILELEGVVKNYPGGRYARA